MIDYKRSEQKEREVLSYLIEGGMLVVMIGLGYLALSNYHNISTKPLPKPAECQIIRAGEEENLGDLVNRMKIYDPGITLEKLSIQNRLVPDLKQDDIPPEELKYCY